jgi:hypothetical protein
VAQLTPQLPEVGIAGGQPAGEPFDGVRVGPDVQVIHGG